VASRQAAAHTGQQLAGGERLDDVVVGPDEEPCRDIERFPTFPRHEDDRELVVDSSVSRA
jgi:hypothetical protein